MQRLSNILIHASAIFGLGVTMFVYFVLGLNGLSSNLHHGLTNTTTGQSATASVSNYVTP